MEFKVLVVVFGLLAVTASASDSVSRYIKKTVKDGEKSDVEIEIDTKKKTETFHVLKTSPDKEEAYIIYDFMKKKTMFRVPIAKACFLYDSTENLPKPEELVQLLERENNKALVSRDSTEVRLNIQNTVDDRSYLSDEMAALCAKLPIYNVAKETPDDDDMPFKRKRRGACEYVCRPSCRRICGWGCTTICTRVCNWLCP